MLFSVSVKAADDGMFALPNFSYFVNKMEGPNWIKEWLFLVRMTLIFEYTLQIMSGLTQVSFMKSLSENDNQQPIVGYLKDIAGHVLTKSSLKYVLTTDTYSPSCTYHTYISTSCTYHTEVSLSFTYHTYISPGRTYHTYISPSCTYHTYISPSRTYHTYISPSRTYHTYISPSCTYHTYISPSRTYHTYISPNCTYHTYISLTYIPTLIW